MRTACWHTSPLPYSNVRKLSEALGASETMAAVLARRGHDTPAKAAAFLDPLGSLHDPFLFPSMDAVCGRLQAAIRNSEPVCVHGDYDVDGITSTALLAGVLGEMGARVSWHLPNRFTEGYGVAMETVEKIAATGARLLVAVDCGITAGAQLRRAAELGMDVIIIDHHRPGSELPPGMIISPLVCDYPFKELAGVGLAFKVAQALLAPGAGGAATREGSLVPDSREPADGGLDPLLQRQLDLVALGTIADVVPLVGENRALVKRGLLQMARSRRPGLEALMQVSQTDAARINAGQVAFRLAPRINAAGRLEDPAPALELLISQDEKEAKELAAALDGLNRKRQQIENQMLAEAEERVGRLTEEQRRQRGYVLSSPKWHEGVIGIVASRMVELHQRPVIMIAENETHGKGSGRSVAAFDLHGALTELDGMLEAYGGHRAACGLTIQLDRLDGFCTAFAELADRELTGEELRPPRTVDAVVTGGELTLELAEELSRLEPFGLGNPSVELLAFGATIRSARRTRDERHLQCQVETGGALATAIGFGQGFLIEKLHDNGGHAVDVAFRLERNDFNGSVSPQLNLREIFRRPQRSEAEPGLCEMRCDIECPQRVRGQEFWSLVRGGAPLPEGWEVPVPGGERWEEAVPESRTDGGSIIAEAGIVEAGIPEAGYAEAGYAEAGGAGLLAGRLIDRRGRGSIPARLASLITTGESVLVLVADVARRRQLAAQLPPLWDAGVDRRVLLAGTRCSSQVIEERARLVHQMKQDGSGQAVMIADFATACRPGLAADFNHLVFVDPPLNERVFRLLCVAAPEAYIHLLQCRDEVQFTGRVLEHEYDLRASLARLYRHLEKGTDYPLDDATERLLLAGGKHLRQPALVARCLGILEELALLRFGEKDSKPILTLPAAGRTQLERSETYNRLQRFYRECSRFLSRSQNAKMA